MWAAWGGFWRYGASANMVEPTEMQIVEKKPLSVRYDPSQLCQCDFDELLGVHVAALCDSLRKTEVFSHG